MSLTNYFSNLFSNFTGSGQLEKENRRKYKIAPDKNAHDPDKAWDLMKRRQKSEVIEPLPNDTPIHPDKVRFVCISDTHSRVEKSRELVIPDGDVLLHAGDLTMYGEPEAVQMVNEYLGSLPHTHKVMIAGNHEMTFDLDLVNRKTFKISPWSLDRDHTKKELARLGVNTVHELLTNCIYLQDAMVQLYGIKIYGSPWTAGHGGWGFQVMRGAPLMSKWDKIPDDTDILITHCPPVGYGDSVMKETFKYKKALNKLYMLGDHVGCVDLLNTIQRRVQPKYSVFGHIHQGYGMYTDGTTTFVNASTCTESYIPTNKPIIFDIPLPDGYSKQISKEEAVKWIIPNKIGHSTEDLDYDIVFDDECSGTRLDEGGTLNSDENGQEILDEASITKSDEIEGRHQDLGANEKHQNTDREIGEGVGSETGNDDAESDAVGGELHGTCDSVAGKENVSIPVSCKDWSFINKPLIRFHKRIYDDMSDLFYNTAVDESIQFDTFVNDTNGVDEQDSECMQTIDSGPVYKGTVSKHGPVRSSESKTVSKRSIVNVRKPPNVPKSETNSIVGPYGNVTDLKQVPKNTDNLKCDSADQLENMAEAKILKTGKQIAVSVETFANDNSLDITCKTGKPSNVATNSCDTDNNLDKFFLYSNERYRSLPTKEHGDNSEPATLRSGQANENSEQTTEISDQANLDSEQAEAGPEQHIGGLEQANEVFKLQVTDCSEQGNGSCEQFIGGGSVHAHDTEVTKHHMPRDTSFDIQFDGQEFLARPLGADSKLAEIYDIASIDSTATCGHTELKPKPRSHCAYRNHWTNIIDSIADKDSDNAIGTNGPEYGIGYTSDMGAAIADTNDDNDDTFYDLDSDGFDQSESESESSVTDESRPLIGGHFKAGGDFEGFVFVQGDTELHGVNREDSVGEEIFFDDCIESDLEADYDDCGYDSPEVHRKAE